MRIVDCGPGQAVSETRFGSTGFHALPLVGWPRSVCLLTLDAGGQIGRHYAVGEQLFVVVSGTGEVSGPDEGWLPVSQGQAVLWSDGESHATRSAGGLIALVAEGFEELWDGFAAD